VVVAPEENKELIGTCKKFCEDFMCMASDFACVGGTVNNMLYDATKELVCPSYFDFHICDHDYACVNGITCEVGMDSCNGQCYDPSLKYCLDDTYVCPDNFPRCGGKTCYNPAIATCNSTSGQQVCATNITKCGEFCYNQSVDTCWSDVLLCGQDEVGCGGVCYHNGACQVESGHKTCKYNACYKDLDCSVSYSSESGWAPECKLMNTVKYVKLDDVCLASFCCSENKLFGDLKKYCQSSFLMGTTAAEICDGFDYDNCNCGSNPLEKQRCGSFMGGCFFVNNQTCINGTVCSIGDTICGDSTVGQLCYNPSSEQCISGQYICEQGEDRVCVSNRRKSAAKNNYRTDYIYNCYDDDDYRCISNPKNATCNTTVCTNGTLCNANQTKLCYDPLRNNYKCYDESFYYCGEDGTLVPIHHKKKGDDGIKYYWWIVIAFIIVFSFVLCVGVLLVVAYLVRQKRTFDYSALNQNAFIQINDANQDHQFYVEDGTPAAREYSRRGEVLFDFVAASENEVSIRVGDKIFLKSEPIGEWWEARLESGAVGLVPATYVNPLD